MLFLHGIIFGCIVAERMGENRDSSDCYILTFKLVYFIRLYWIECRTEYATISDIVGFGCVLFVINESKCRIIGSVINVEQILLPYYWFITCEKDRDVSTHNSHVRARSDVN